MEKLIINKQYLAIVPRPSDEDYEDLKDSMSKNGQLVSIIINEKNEIIDGHTRYQICNELMITPKTVVKKFKKKEEELLYVISLNFQRRHLTVFQKVEAILPFYEELHQQAKLQYNTQPLGKNGRRRLGKSTQTLLVYLIAKHVDNDNSHVKKCLDILQSKDKNLIANVKNEILTPSSAYQLLQQNKAIAKRIKNPRLEPVSTSEHTDAIAPTSYEDTRYKNTAKRSGKIPPSTNYTEIVRDLDIECTICNGTGKIFFTELVDKLKFTPGWFVAGIEHHFFIAPSTPICFKRAKINSSVVDDFEGFRCVKCKKLYDEIIKKKSTIKVTSK